MIRQVRSRFALALACCAGLAALLNEELRKPSDPSMTGKPALAGSAEAASIPAVERFKAAAIETTQEIVDRPLFFASRRPLPPEPPQAVQVKQEPPPVLDFALVGTVMTTKARVALVKPDKSGWMQLEPGQSVGRWTVTAIDTDRITVRSGAVEQMVGVREFGTAHVLPAAMRAPAGAPPAAAPDTPTGSAPAPPPPSSPLRRAGTRR